VCRLVQLPTVWIAEGLLMYIDPPAVAALLQEAAEASAGGSSFLAQVCANEVCIRFADFTDTLLPPANRECARYHHLRCAETN
jgi:O-methyltransferase involved in polyketide biosynthesis